MEHRPQDAQGGQLPRPQRRGEARIRETHPEVRFWALAGRPMQFGKKTRAGFAERREVLRSCYAATDEVVQDALASHRRSGVGKDDILDALVAGRTG